MLSRFLVPFHSASRSAGPADPLSELHRQMNRLFDDFLEGGPAPASGGLMAVPRLDVRENAHEICVCAELPGVDPSDVELHVEGNVLTLRGEKREEAERGQEDYHVMERSFGRFQRSLQLPFAPDPGQVKAGFEHGVLTVHVPKQPQQERGRRIPIEGGAPGADPGGAQRGADGDVATKAASGAAQERTHH